MKVMACAFILFSPGAHIPIRSYKLSILIHPLTMETCGIAIFLLKIHTLVTQRSQEMWPFVEHG